MNVERIRKFIPKSSKPLLRKIRSLFYYVAYVRPAAMCPHFCPVCEKGLRKFLTITWGDTTCCLCKSSERHRLVWLFFHKRTQLFDGKPRKMLHVAAEIQFERVLAAKLGSGYITADLLDPGAMIRMDITNIEYPDESFDVIYCSHVLEHVINDTMAMREFARVLKPDGWAVILVPITSDKTFEDPSVIDPKDRLRIFGQEDHVRIYGPDFVERLKSAGLAVQKISSSDFLTIGETARFNITQLSGDVFYCTKRKTNSVLSR
jgi:SAM-dependent methyltransferase